MTTEYDILSASARSFVSTIDQSRYDRGIVAGLQKFMDGAVPTDMRTFYSTGELEELVRLAGTEKDVEARMPVKITRHYFNLAKHSPSLQALIKANPRETEDLEGAEDPGLQMSFSPIEGLIHKYEAALIYVSATCSAHCRFCYREELIARKAVRRSSGSIAPKGLARVADVVDYIRRHNENVDANLGKHPETGRARLREIIMSGGDPMVLSNRQIAIWLCALAGAGIEAIRIGTKELAFHPGRFDEPFMRVLDGFHLLYPRVSLRFLTHFNHPDEFLQPERGNMPHGELEWGRHWLPTTAEAIDRLKQRPWIGLENQAPIIKGINDDAATLRSLQRELKQTGIENHYFFCGRDIIGHKSFNLPIENAWRILNESQKGLSGVEIHARLSITHFKGKTEVAAVTDNAIVGLAGSEHGVVIFKLLRSYAEACDRGKVAIVARNPDAIWFSDYRDRVLFDEAGLFQTGRF